MPMKYAVLLLFGAFCGVNAQSQLTPGQQAYTAEQELNGAFNALMTDCAFIPKLQRLKTEQTVWYQYRETLLDSEFPVEYTAEDKAIYLAQLNRERTIKLQDLFLELEKQGVCTRK
jgi:uncharacterized protein YecT (DUF1311 family)